MQPFPDFKYALPTLASWNRHPNTHRKKHVRTYKGIHNKYCKWCQKVADINTNRHNDHHLTLPVPDREVRLTDSYSLFYSAYCFLLMFCLLSGNKKKGLLNLGGNYSVMWTLLLCTTRSWPLFLCSLQHCQGRRRSSWRRQNLTWVVSIVQKRFL